MTNDTCDDNMPATVTSTVSVNVRTEEPSEVPEISTSSTFFRQERCLVILKQYTPNSVGKYGH